VEGRPEDLDGAWDLARRDKYQFQWWANWLVGVQNYREHKRGGDGGIDGKIFFKNGPMGTGRVIVSVKGGETVNPSMVRDLIGTVEAEEAELGLFVCLSDPTTGMREVTQKAGIVKTAHGPFPRVQIITIRELLEGKRPNLPPYYVVEDDSRPEKQRIQIPDPQMQFKFAIPGAGKERQEEVIYPAAHFLLSRAGR
jgi:site-specific DNA-methyltransferase (adenine-specific)